MQTQTALPITRTEWSPVSKITLACAMLYAAFFRFLHPILADRCGDRIEKAVQIMIRAGARRQTCIAGVFEVESESGRGWYEVDVNRKSCTCPDSQSRTDIICKHRLAVGLQLVGPSWTTEAMKAQAKATRLASVNVEAALVHLAQCGDTLENIAIRQGQGLQVSDLEIDLARSSNAEASAEVIRLQTIRDALISKPIHEFAA